MRYKICLLLTEAVWLHFVESSEFQTTHWLVRANSGRVRIKNHLPWNQTNVRYKLNKLKQGPG